MPKIEKTETHPLNATYSQSQESKELTEHKNKTPYQYLYQQKRVFPKLHFG